MKAGWQETALGSVALVGAGNSAPQGAALFADGIYPFFRTSDAGRIRFGDITESTDYLNEEGIKGLRRFPAGTILFPKSGASTFLNHRVMLSVDGYVSSHLATIVGDEAKVDRRFLLYFLSTISAQDLIQDHAYPSLNLPLIAGIPVALPPLPEQHRVVAILDEAFDGITTAKANAEKNLQNARALFESHLQSVFTERGEGFEETTLGKVCEFVGGSQPPKAVFQKEQMADNIRLIQIRDYKTDKHIVFIPRSMAKRFCNADDVMIGRYGPPLFQILRGLDGAYNVALMKAVPNESKLSRDYLFYFLKHSDILQYVIYHSDRAAGQIGVTKETLEPYPIALPSHEAQKSVVTAIMELESDTQRLESLYQQKLTALDDLKKSLLHQAFSGAL
ncbi:MAG: restriction endonuclease subunit S [Azonexus sp.]